MEDLEKKRDGGDRYVALGRGIRGNGAGVVSLKSQLDVAMHVAPKRAFALSLLEMHITPSALKRVGMRGDGLGPAAYFFA